MNFDTVNDSLKEDPVATKTKNWGSYCKTIAWIAFFVLEFFVITISSVISSGQLGYDVTDSWFVVFLIGTVISFLCTSPMFIFGTILAALAQIVQNTSSIAVPTKTANKERKDAESIWTCPYCGVENEPWDNVCGYCHKKKAE